MKMQLCKFEPLHISNSTRRDAVIFTHNKLSKKFLRSIVSLRYVDGNCRIIMLLQDNYKISREASRMINTLNAEIYFTTEILKPEYLKIGPIVRRFYAEQAWLRIYGHELDRVFHSDSTDVFFVGSPFNSFKSDTLYFVSENASIDSNRCNKDWMHALVGHEEYLKYKQKDIINGGSVGGSCSEYQKFLDIFTQKKYTEKCWNFGSCDQPLIIWLIHSGKLTDIKYEVLQCSSGFATMILCKPNIEDQYKSFITWYPFKIVFFHQFKHYPDAERYINKLCQVGDEFSRS